MNLRESGEENESGKYYNYIISINEKHKKNKMESNEETTVEVNFSSLGMSKIY